jgi:hypothetical protein
MMATFHNFEGFPKKAVTCLYRHFDRSGELRSIGRERNVVIV